MEELKKCPFCGEKAYFRTDANGYQKENRMFSFHIECRSCKLAFPKAFELEFSLNENGELQFSKDERDKAVHEWNRRCCD